MADLAWDLRREERQLARAKGAFRQYAAVFGLGLWGYIVRYSQIRGLPDTSWHGRPLKATTCPRCGKRRNYPESSLWLVVDVHHVICPWCLVRG